MSRARSVRGRIGFSLIAIVVTVAVLAIIAAVAAPLLRESSHEMAAVRTAQILHTLALDLTNNTATNGTKGFCVQVTVCPGQLQHLTRQILSTEIQACGGTAYGGNTTKWITAAPYSGLSIAPGYGVWTPLGVVHDSVLRTSRGNIELHIDSVSLNDAASLDSAMDFASTPTTGTLTYAATAVNNSGQTLELVKYLIAVSNTQCP